MDRKWTVHKRRGRRQGGINGDVRQVICDTRTTAEVKGQVYKTAVRAAMMYGLETVALYNKEDAGQILEMSRSEGRLRWRC